MSAVKEDIEGVAQDKDNGTGGELKTATRKKKAAASSSKVRELKTRLAAVEEERDSLKDQLLRKVAEFDNYRKRKDAEFAQVLVNANANLISDLLSVFDDLERSVASPYDADDLKGFRNGVELIYKNLKKILESRGVSPIEAIGEKFDPEMHEALMQVESEEKPPGIVIDEHLKGYVMNDRVLRHSQVLVSK